MEDYYQKQLYKSIS